MKAHITYLSKTGITRKYAAEIEGFLREKKHDSIIESIHDADLSSKRLVLFTTYKLATGSMFKKITRHLKLSGEQDPLILKSKNGSLTEEDKKHLLDFIG